MQQVVNRDKSSADSLNNGAFFQCCSVLILSYKYAHQDSKFLVKKFSMFNIAHLLKFVVNFNFIIMSKLKCIGILTGLFGSVVASGTSHFYSFFFS